MVTESPNGYVDRRELFERRLARANRIDAAVTAACSGPIFDGLTLEQVDHDGMLRQSIKALVGSAGSGGSDLDLVIHRGPHSPWGLRIVVSGDDVEILPVQIGMASQIGVGPQGGAAGPGGSAAVESADAESFDFSQAAELAAMMWKNR